MTWGRVKNVYHDVTFYVLGKAQVQNNMASDKLARDSTENSAESEHAEYIERVKNFLRPLEKRWDYIQNVLLWEKPSHSLGYFIAMTVLVG